MDNVFEPDLQEAVQGAEHPTRASGILKCLRTVTPLHSNWLERANTLWAWLENGPTATSSAWTLRVIGFGGVPNCQSGSPNQCGILGRASSSSTIFGPGEVADIWLTFSDPQPKDEKGTKRITSGKFIERYRSFRARGHSESQVRQQVVYALSKRIRRRRLPDASRFGRRLRWLSRLGRFRFARGVGDQDLLRAALVERKEHPFLEIKPPAL